MSPVLFWRRTRGWQCSQLSLPLFQESGLSLWLGNQLTPLQNIPPAAIALLLCLLVATFTECTSNVATTTLFLPILASMVSPSFANCSWRKSPRCAQVFQLLQADSGQVTYLSGASEG